MRMDKGGHTIASRGVGGIARHSVLKDNHIDNIIMSYAHWPS